MTIAGAEGGCQCRRIRYRLDREPIFVNGCHCRDCQTQSGSAFAINIMIEATAMRVTAGEARPDALGMMRCPDCQTALWGTHPMFGESIRFVRAGTLDRGDAASPDAHFFVRSKHPWVTLPPHLPAYDTLPEAGDAPVLDEAARARVAAAMAAV